MKTINKVILLGRVGADPVLIELENNGTLVRFPLATQKKIATEAQSEGGEACPTVLWHHIVVWDRLAQACANYVKKGDPVYLEGELRKRSYQDQQGVGQSVTEVHAREVCFLGPPSRKPQQSSIGLSGQSLQQSPSQVEFPDANQEEASSQAEQSQPRSQRE